MIRFSVNMHRGCFGGCSFCTISAHQGKFVVSRSEASILKEVEQITQDPGFKGHITDLGGPSANMYRMGGINKTCVATANALPASFRIHAKTWILITTRSSGYMRRR
jgi:radical SAM superfamily enzyme YgiQ (UPF0313 family)